LQNGETEVKHHYDYDKQWVKNPVRSDGFHYRDHHENFGSSPFSSETFKADGIKLGNQFYLSDPLSRQLTRSRPMSPAQAKRIPAGGSIQGNAIYFSHMMDNAKNVNNANTNEQNEQDPLETKTMTVDGVERTMYVDKATGETFSSRDGAMKVANKAMLEAALDTKTMTVDGVERIMYVVKATGETFSSKEGAMEVANKAIMEAALDTKTMTVDGVERTMYVVKATGETFSSKDLAMEAAKKAPPPPAARKQRNNPGNTKEPQIGDARVTFSEVPCTTVSVLARLQSNNVLSPWPSQQGPGYDIGMVTEGQVTAEEMITRAQSTNVMMTWLKRLAGWFLCFIGYSMITSIITTTADITLNWIPLLGPMTTSIISLGVSIANFILATCTSLPVAAAAWVFYRPILGITMLVGSLGLFYAASQAGGRVENKNNKTQ
jgi:hypothetical protein